MSTPTAPSLPPGAVRLPRRRRFLQEGLRYALLALLTGLGGWLVRQRIEAGADADCPLTLPCRRCAAWGTCPRPPAVAARTPSLSH